MIARIRPTRRVAVVAFDGVVPFDLSTPCELFGRTVLRDGRAPYQVKVCGVTPRVQAGAFTIGARWTLAELRRADTVIVPGVADIDAPVSPALVRALRSAAARGARIASICSGTFVLAAAGLLEGKRVTTHWLVAAELARRYPGLTVDPSVLYVDHGNLLTSAGAAAGLDLCLHLVRKDFGAAAAAQTARCAVMPLEREGGQAQFIVHEPPEVEGASLQPLLRWMEDHLGEELSLAALARRAGMSIRTLTRRFREQVGASPTQWLLRARVRRAQLLLEKTSAPIERVAADTGFGSAAGFREHFRRVVGASPRAYRGAFRGAAIFRQRPGSIVARAGASCRRTVGISSETVG